MIVADELGAGIDLTGGWSREEAQTEARAEIDVSELVREHAALLFRVAHSVVRSRSEAEDVVQDVFVRVMERRGKLQEVREMRVWLVRIAWNLAVDRRRRVRPEQMDDEFAAALMARERGPEKTLVEAREMTAVLREIDRLPKAERQVLLLASVGELGTGAIAEVVGKSESGVRALVFRARKRLRERLGEEVRR